MKKVRLEESPHSLAEYAHQAATEPLVLTEDGKPIAALVSIEDSDWESLSLSTNPDFLRILERSRERLRKEGGIPIEEVRKRLGLG